MVYSNGSYISYIIIYGICFSKPLKENHESQPQKKAALHELLSKSLAFPAAQWQGLIQVGAQLLHGFMICYDNIYIYVIFNDSNMSLIFNDSNMFPMIPI